MYLSEDYLAALSAELCYYRDNFSPEYRTLYIGGGTPTSLNVKQLDSLFTRIYWLSDRKKMIEMTIEANPETITEKNAKVLAANLNRVSLGCQSFDDSMLKKLGRIHGAAAILRAVKILRDCGIGNISLDLMFGLPGQTVAEALADIKSAIETGPSHISWYMLTPHENQPFRAMVSAGGGLPPDGETEEMYNEGVRKLEEAGYLQYEISNFAKPGAECLHNINYWTMGEYVGVGASASSFFNGSRYTNVGDIREYIGRIARKEDPAMFSEKMTEENRLKEYIMLALRMKKGLVLETFKERFGFDFKDRYSNIIKKFVNEGLVKEDKKAVTLTVKGFLLSNRVISGFFA